MLDSVEWCELFFLLISPRLMNEMVLINNNNTEEISRIVII